METLGNEVCEKKGRDRGNMQQINKESEVQEDLTKISRGKIWRLSWNQNIETIHNRYQWDMCQYACRMVILTRRCHGKISSLR